MIPVPFDLIKGELETAYDRAVDNLIIVNASNIRPHGLSATLLADFWNRVRIDLEGTLENLASTYLKTEPKIFVQAFRRYGEASFNYGPESDEKVGDQFYTYTLMAILSQRLKQKISDPVPSLLWLSQADFPRLVEDLPTPANDRCGEELWGSSYLL